MGWQLLAVSGAAAALAALSALLWLPSNDFAPLDRRPWQDRDAPLWQAVHTKPFIITGSPADQWPAAGWTVARLAQLLPSRLDVRSSDSSASPVFRYASKAAPGEHRTMSWTQLVQAAEAAATGTTPAPALYFSTSLDDAAFAAVAAEIGSPTPFLTRSQAARHELHLWAGTAGASAALHYDTSHNTFVQLSGTKTFYLLPPAAHFDARPFPVGHRHDRQSQLSWTPEDCFSLWSRGVGWASGSHLCSGFIATLAPGDVLVLPAHWLHFVRTESALSISVNMWFKSSEHEALDAVFRNPLPFYRKSWLRDQALCAIQRFIVRVILASLGDAPICKKQSPNTCGARFIQLLLDSKYRLGNDPHSGPATCSSASARGLDELLEQHVVDTARVLQSMNSSAVRLLYLAVWTEKIATFALGSSSDDDNVTLATANFLEHCLDFSE
eukprot:m.22511 g.22511  ORF g.22511 m.22511 type:complete len:441 (-) comp4010_c0_seq2:32-1354(-)